MHGYQCSVCRGVFYHPSPPEWRVSRDPARPDTVPVVCPTHRAFMFYIGYFPPQPVFHPPHPSHQTPFPPTGPSVHAVARTPSVPKPVQKPAPPQPANALVNKPMVPAPTIWTVQDLDKQDYVREMERIRLFLSERDLLTLRLVSKAHRDFAERILKGFFTPARLAYATSERQNMKAFISGWITTAEAVRISVDQLTDPALLNDLVGNDVAKVKGVNAGRLASNPNRTLKSFDDTFGGYSRDSAVIDLPENEKMHNKFYLVGGTGVITGSPNLSFKGLNNNQECAVYIKHPMVAILFREYFERIRRHPSAVRHPDAPALGASTLSDGAFTDQIARFNADNRIRVALAPFVNIRDFVYEELQRAEGAVDVKITLRQFVVDQPTAEQKDILRALIALKQAGAEVSVVLDKGQFDEACVGRGRNAVYYVQEACKELAVNGVSVYLQQKGGSIMHEKLVLVEFMRNKRRTKTVLIGSAGFTKNVSENKNYENIVAIDEDRMYDYFLARHRESLTPDQARGNWSVSGAGATTKL